MPDHVLLAIDVGRVAGWACGSLTDIAPVEVGTYRLPTSSVRDLLGSRLDAFDRWLDPLFARLGPTLVVMAERFMGRNTGEAAVSFALDGLVRMRAYRRGTQILCQPEGTVRKEILGRGSGPSELMKQLAMDWCRAHGIDAMTDHEADSAVLWYWARNELVRQSTTCSGQPDGTTLHVVGKKKRNNVAQKPATVRLKAEAAEV